MPDPTEEIQYCRNLRTKKMYIPAYSLHGDPREETDTAQYGCLRTQTGIGPEGTLVRSSECRPGRPCCEVDV